MDFYQFGQELMKGKNAKVLQQAADSDAGRKLSNIVDAKEVERAAKQGDAKALEDILRKVMSTPEGKALAEEVKKAVGPNGRGS